MPTDPRTILTSMPVHRALLDHVAPPETDLTPVDRELAGVVVSYALGSIDAGDDHREALADLLPVDRRAIAVVVRSGDESYLTPRESVIARASLSLATDPGGLTVPLLGDLREAGVSDAAVIELARHVACLVYSARVIQQTALDLHAVTKLARTQRREVACDARSRRLHRRRIPRDPRGHHRRGLG